MVRKKHQQNEDFDASFNTVNTVAITSSIIT